MKGVLENSVSRLIKGKNFRRLLRESWTMGWPLILIMLFEFFVSLTDVYIAGLMGKETQGAVGLVGQIYFVFVVLANGITVGTVSVVSRISGSKDKKAFADAVYTIGVAVLISGIALSLAGIFFAPLAVAKSSLPNEIKEIAEPFVKVYFSGLIFHYILINTNGLLRAAKKVRRSLLTMTFVMLTNIGLNIIFYAFTDFGFRGIALSTAASYAVGALINAPSFVKIAAQSSRTFSINLIRKILSIGWPTLVLQSSWQLGSIVMFLILGALPTMSVETIAGFTNGLRIESAIFLPAYALNMAAAAITGNMLGEGRKKDAYYGGFVTAFMGMCVILLLSLAVILNANHLASLLSPNEHVIRESVKYLVIQMISEPFMAIVVILSGALNGAGDTRGVMMIVTFSLWLVRIPLSYLLAIKLGFGAAGVWWAMNTDIFIRMLVTLHRYRKKRWLQN